MSHKRLVIITLFHFVILNCYCQSFVNGDLVGPFPGPNSLPTDWQNVPYSDLNCLALNPGEDTPDLTSANSQYPVGNPYHGLTFISGLNATQNNGNNFWHEGIMQVVSGFTVENSYTIRFHQTVVKDLLALDKSGAWAVYIDTLLAGITFPTYSNEPVGSLTLPWEARSITFTARAITHLIKFLPMDDDTNNFTSLTDTTAALRMGIDSIGLEVLTSLNEQTHNKFSLFPNPNIGCFRLQYKGTLAATNIFSITDIYGKQLDQIEIINSSTEYENTRLNNGLYFYTIRQGIEELGRGKFMVIH
jgi:hypothetical protein